MIKPNAGRVAIKHNYASIRFWGTGYNVSALLKNIKATYFKTIKMFICTPVNLYQGNNSKDTSYRHKDFHSSFICSKLRKYKCKINVNVK